MAKKKAPAVLIKIINAAKRLRKENPKMEWKNAVKMASKMIYS